MLPDDLENLAQSVVATNFFANNLLQVVTTKNYWDVVNEFKPLMHTWSLAVEEQFYLFFPFAMALGIRIFKRGVWVPLALTTFATWMVTNISGMPEYLTFYLLPFRIWELLAGGVLASQIGRQRLSYRTLKAAFPFLLVLISGSLEVVGKNFERTFVVIATVAFLASDNTKSPALMHLVANKGLRFIGAISYSIYMWHQVLLAFMRYLYGTQLNIFELTLFAVLLFGFSILTYYAVEQPFRNANSTSNRTVLLFVIVGLVTTTIIGLLVYNRAGVIRNIPELGVSTKKVQRGMHSQYNHRIYDLDRDFQFEDKVKVLVVGNSFARDWANVLQESEMSSKIDISYLFSSEPSAAFSSRISECDVAFFTPPLPETIWRSFSNKIWVIGVKNFGTSNGKFYNSRDSDYYSQTTPIEAEYLDENYRLRIQYGSRYLDYFAKVINENKEVPVFTDDKMFISQDCRHLTQAGARFFSRHFALEIAQIIHNNPANVD